MILTQATILIIDDSADNRLLLSSQLSQAGYQIVHAGNGKEGIQLAESNLPDLILLDVMMPHMNGFEVCARLKRQPQTAPIPIIMVTALRDVTYRIRGIEAGADEFLSRPHHREELLLRVRLLIELKRTRQQLEQARQRLRLLYDISQVINTELALEKMLADIIVHLQVAVEAEEGSILLLNTKGRVTHKIGARAGNKGEITRKAARIFMYQGLVAWLVQHNRGEIIPDTAVDARWVKRPDHAALAGSAIGVPLSRADHTVGVLILVHRERHYFQPTHLSLLETIAGQLTTAIEYAYLLAKINT